MKHIYNLLFLLIATSGTTCIAVGDQKKFAEQSMKYVDKNRGEDAKQLLEKREILRKEHLKASKNRRQLLDKQDELQAEEDMLRKRSKDFQKSLEGTYNFSTSWDELKSIKKYPYWSEENIPAEELKELKRM